MRPFLLPLALLLSAAAPLTAGAAAADYPNKPIKIVVPFSAGSATDKLARVVGEGLSQRLGQPVVVENKGGASGFIGSTQVARAAPDGYTLLVTANTTHSGNAALFKQLPYDPVADFSPLSRLGNIPLAMIVHPSIPAGTVAEFIDYARQRPGKLFFGSGSTSARVAGEMLKSATGIDVSNVQYKGNPEAVTDLAGGHVHFMIADVATTLPLAQAGKAKALAVASSKPTELAPGLPTIETSGKLPGFEMVGWFAAYAPAGTPEPIVARLHAAIADLTQDASVRQKLMASGIEPVSSTPAELASFQAAETAKWKKLVAEAGIPVQ